jgi:hypothetical protein
VLRPCCAERLVGLCKPLISLVSARNILQHETDGKNEAETATNPLFAGLTAGALGEIRTPDPRIRSPMLYPAELRAHQCFQQVSRKPRFLGPDQVPENTAEILRQPRLSELNGRSYPKKTAPSQVPGALNRACRPPLSQIKE